MTVPGFGRITPIQGDMLRLAGYNLNPGKFGFDPRRIRSQQIPHEDRIAIMMEERLVLVSRTGQDFGFDLAAWQEYLEAHPEMGYTHPYAYRSTRMFVVEAQIDPQRQRLVETIEKSP